jgi:hypothetical protein
MLKPTGMYDAGLEEFLSRAGAGAILELKRRFQAF